MGFLDRLLGRSRDERSYHGVPGQPGHAPQQPGYAPGKQGYAAAPGQHPAGSPTTPGYGASGTASAQHGRSADDVAVERYRYLLRTAPPDAVEQAHAEAFAKLTPEQRQRVLAELGAAVPAAERSTSDDPQSLARMATRAEMRNPGTLEQTFRGRPGQGAYQGPSMGAMIGSSLLGTIAGVVIGSAVANALFGPAFGDPSQDIAGDAGSGEAGSEGGDAGQDAEPAGTEGDAGSDAGADPGYTEASGADGGGFFDGGGFDGGGFDGGGFDGGF